MKNRSPYQSSLTAMLFASLLLLVGMVLVDMAQADDFAVPDSEASGSSANKTGETQSLGPKTATGWMGGRGDTRGRGKADDLENHDTTKRCRYANTSHTNIEVFQIEPIGNIFSGEYQFSGAVSGACLAQVGYFEGGKLIEQIEFPLDDRYARREFALKVRLYRQGELRAVTSNGEKTHARIEDIIHRRRGVRR